MRDPVKPPWSISSGFGWRRHPVTGARALHEGIDIPVRVGTKVYAPLAGRVHSKGTAGAAGNYLILQHSATLRTRYNHLQRVPSVTGRVSEGQHVANSGGRPGDPGAGSSSGPHLHFAVYVLIDGRWTPIDPAPWLKARPASDEKPRPSRPSTEEQDDIMRYVYVDDYDGKGTAAWVLVNTITGKTVAVYDQDRANGWATAWGPARKINRQQYLNMLDAIAKTA